MTRTNIEWTNRVWNPVRGCSKVSEGCRNCYAMRQAHRFSQKGQPYFGLTKATPIGPEWTGKVQSVPDLLDAPLRWKKPSRVFVNSMSDLFHSDVPYDFVAKVWVTMARTPQHTYQILTKRPVLMRDFFEDCLSLPPGPPLPNVWLGVSVEDQRTADERIPILLQTPAALRWVSYEPALGPVDFTIRSMPNENDDRWMHDTLRGADGYEGRELLVAPRLDWLVVGGESGPGARPFDIEWARSAVKQCKAAGVPVFVKQLGRYPMDYNDNFANGGPAGLEKWPDPVEPHRDYVVQYQGEKCPVALRDPKGGDMTEWPENLRVREWPQDYQQ